VTNFIDLDTGALLFMKPGKDGATIREFVEQLIDYKGTAKSITEIAMDMSPAFKKGLLSIYLMPKRCLIASMS
jgi:transposase